MINWIKNKLHIHCFSKPIASQYVSFNSRDIIFECSCGKRKMERVQRDYGDAFPIQTTHFITNAQMRDILYSEKIKL